MAIASEDVIYPIMNKANTLQFEECGAKIKEKETSAHLCTCGGKGKIKEHQISYSLMAFGR